MLHQNMLQVAVGIRPGDGRGHTGPVFSEQCVNMSIIVPRRLSHEVKGHLFDL